MLLVSGRSMLLRWWLLLLLLLPGQLWLPTATASLRRWGPCRLPNTVRPLRDA